MHPPEHRPRLTIAHRAAVESSDREHFLRRRGYPDFIRVADGLLRHRPDPTRKPVALRELDHDVVRDAWKHEIIFRRREDGVVRDDEYVARRAFGEMPVTEHYDFQRACIRCRLPQQAVAEQ